MAPKLIIFKLMVFNLLQKLSLHRNHLLLKLEKYNHFAEKEEDSASIPLTLILPTLLYSCKRIAIINSLKHPVKRKLQD